AIKCKEAGGVDLYKIDQLQSMRLAKEAWDHVGGQTVANCWCHAGILSPRDANRDLLQERGVQWKDSQSEKSPNILEIRAAVDKLNEVIQALAKKSIAPSRVMTATEILNCDDGETEGSLEDEEIMNQVLKDQRMEKVAEEGDEVDNSDDNLDEILKPVISPSEGMQYLRDLACLFDLQKGLEFQEAPHLISKLLSSLNLAVEGAQEQKDYYFPWLESP
ncbi:hypothetical protein FRC01_002147, partial [Tulasnella sp. 417]